MKRARHRCLIALCVLLLSVPLAACGEDDGGDPAGTPDTSTSTDTSADTSSGMVTDTSSDTETSPDADMEMMPPGNPEDCDPLDPDVCALPWPSSLYLAEDASRGTGYTLTFGPTSLPKNSAGDHIDPEAYRRMDGYGLGTPIMVTFPDLDISMLPKEDSIGASVEADARVILLQVNDDDSTTRVPYWVELDTYPTTTTPAESLLFIRPAVILEEGTRYIVALRGLTSSSGAAIEPSAGFAALRDGVTSEDPLLAPRQARFDDIFSILEAGASVTKSELVLAWDFTTASSDGLHGYMLDVIDKGFAAAGDRGPELTVTKVDRYSNDGTLELHDDNIALRIEGTFEVPHFMRSIPMITNGSMGWVFNFGADGMPEQSGTRTATFYLAIPHGALDGTPHGLVMYGHGLLGEGVESIANWNSANNNKISADEQLMYFGCDLIGMAEVDYPSVVEMLRDFSFFPVVADRLHQGMLEYHLLTRAMASRFDEVIPQVEAMLDDGTTFNIVAAPGELYYSGISQGGIFGATFMATSPDVTRGHLGVPGNNYSTLLQRSSNFSDFFLILRGYYRDATDRAIALAAIQQLWDGVDSISYLRRVTADPFEGNAPRHVLLAPAKGDWQVAVVTNEIAARSDIGIPLMTPYDAEREPWGIPTQGYPYTGSGVVLYDFGNPWPPLGNIPPDEDGEFRPDLGEVDNPHGKPRKSDTHTEQLSHFFRTGEIIDVCGGDGCTPD